MKVKHIFTVLCSTAALLSTTSCNDWLTEESPGSTSLKDFFTSGMTAIQSVNACYTPLAWEYNYTYCSEWYIGDIASDDALKGGQNLSDMANAYDMENFKTNANNDLLLDFYRAQYQGIARCNLALQEVPGVTPDENLTEERKSCLLGEAYFMRALYYFRLVRIFGGVPYTNVVIDSSDDWQQSRQSADYIYDRIIEDLIQAERLLWNKSEYPDTDLGRATKGAAQAMLLKVYLYRHDYPNAIAWGRTFMEQQYDTGEYDLFPNYYDNFTLAGENGIESVFEIQYMENEQSDYGGNNGEGGFGYTRGTFTTIMTRARTGGANAGWGLNHPTQNLYDEFEVTYDPATGNETWHDPRREYTICAPSPEAVNINAELTYLGNSYNNNKTAFTDNPLAASDDPQKYITLKHPSRSPLNYRLIRLSDVMLMYAEALVEGGGDQSVATTMLNAVRGRVGAPLYPGYKIRKWNGSSYVTDEVSDLREAIRHERRVELGMEGHRWFDLCRWGIVYDVMNKENGSYGSTESEEVRAEMAMFIKGKHELFPIPAEEINLNPMEQNPGY